MRSRFAFAALALGAFVMLSAGEAGASSHREAPFITKHPKVDNTDVYAFRSYAPGKGNFVTVIANFNPIQVAYAGPNFYTMDPEALYEIHIDNTGDGKEDLTFQFKFTNALGGAGGNGINLDIGTGMQKKSVNIPFINANLGTGNAPPAITSDNQGSFRHVNESYSLKMVKGGRRTGAAQDVTHDAGQPGADAKTFVKPLDFVGLKSFGENQGAPGGYANYNAYADAHIYNITIPGCATKGKAFVGQRHEAFAVNLADIFDLVNASVGALTDPNGGPGPGADRNFLADKNVTSLALELPIECIKGAAPNDKVIGVWSTASLRQARMLNPTETYTKPSREGGPWVQVSRLGMPLVNEVVIGLKDKDKFNSSEPKDDAANFADYVTNPTLPAVIEALLGPTVKAPTLFPREDLVLAFLKGVPGVNAFSGNNLPLTEMIRLNVDTSGSGIPPTPRANQSRLGAAGCFEDDPAAGARIRKLNPGLATCDPGGFPNGRRPIDDTVDIALRVAMGALLNSDTLAPARDFPLGDYARQTIPDAQDFPYLDPPYPGSN